MTPLVLALALLLSTAFAAHAAELQTIEWSDLQRCDGGVNQRTILLPVRSIRVHKVVIERRVVRGVFADFEFSIRENFGQGTYLAGDNWDRYAEPTAPHATFYDYGANWVRATGAIHIRWYCAALLAEHHQIEGAAAFGMVVFWSPLP